MAASKQLNLHTLLSVISWHQKASADETFAADDDANANARARVSSIQK
jgi:hypothetical protein